MHIEKLTPQFIPSSYELCLALRKQDTNPCSFWGYEFEDLEQLPKSSDKCAYLALIDDQVVGIGTLAQGGRFQEHWAEISIATHPSHRSRNIGKALALKLEQEAKSRGLDFIKAMILENNTPSKNFFKSLGYQHRATLFHEFKFDDVGPLNDCVFYKDLMENT